jgi:hypothetical protein
MKNSTPFFLGVFLTSLGFIACQHVLNKEAKLRCLETQINHKIVQGRTFLGDTTMCVHNAEITLPVVSYR